MGKLGVGCGHNVHNVLTMSEMYKIFLSISVMAQIVKNPPAM